MQTVFFDALMWISVTALLIYVMWTRSRLPRPSWLKMLNPIAFWLFLPWPVASMAVACLDTSVSRFLVTLIMIGLFAGHFLWPAISHRRRQVPAAGPCLRVMTCNLFRKNKNAKGIADTILAEAPDIVAIQELKRKHIEAIREYLSHSYPYQMLYAGTDSEGMGLLSNRPFQAAETRTLIPGANPTQIASIALGNRRLWILNVHLRIPHLQTVTVAGVSIPIGLDSRERRKDIEAILEVATELEEDAVLLGDMNMTSQCEEYQLIPSRWRNVHTYAGWGLGLTYPIDEPFFGIPLPFPLFGIDHIFHRGELEAVTCHTGQMPGSDHRYLIADLQGERLKSKNPL